MAAVPSLRRDLNLSRSHFAFCCPFPLQSEGKNVIERAKREHVLPRDPVENEVW